MIIKYTFANGERTEVEVDENIGTVIVESRKKEHASDEKERYHCFSYDSLLFEGTEVADSATPESELQIRESNRYLYEALKILTPIQKRRLIMYSEGLSYREIARQEQVSDHKKIIKSIEEARKKLLTFFENRGPKTPPFSAYGERHKKSASRKGKQV